MTHIKNEHEERKRSKNIEDAQTHYNLRTHIENENEGHTIRTHKEEA